RPSDLEGLEEITARIIVDRRLDQQHVWQLSGDNPHTAATESFSSPRRYEEYLLAPTSSAKRSNCPSSTYPRRHAISSGDAMLNPCRFCIVSTKLDASCSDSCVPVSSHAVPRLINSILSSPRRRYSRFTSVISYSPRADGW